MRIIFMGSPGFAIPSLEQLVLNRHTVVAVYTQQDKPAGRGRALVPPAVKVAALKMGITVIQPENIRTEAAVAQLAEFKPDIVVVCAYGQILPKSLLDIPSYQCLNVHFSLLPRHRGASPVASTIIAGDEFAGVSIMIVSPKMDTGPVLSRAAVAIAPQDNAGTLTWKLSLVGANLLTEVMTGWLRGEIKPLPQDDSRATYFNQIKKEEGEIDWKLPAINISRRVRAFNPWPGCYTTWKGKQIKIIAAEVMNEAGSPGAGVVTALPGRDGGLGIGTGESVLGVLTIQMEGKRAVSAAEFLRGQRGFIGETLPS